MLRILIAMVVLTAGLLGGAVPVYPALAGNTMANTNYPDNPPEPFDPPMTAERGEKETYLYDLSTSMQVSYWGAVVDGIGQKFASYSTDIASLDSTTRIWEFIEEKDISINKREAQVLCLFMTEDDEEPEDSVIPDWPEDGWPNCGGILETMFGPDIIAYLKTNAGNKNRLAIYQHLFSSMGIDAKEVQDTINERMAAAPGQGADNLEFEDDPTTDGRICYTPANNIKRYDVTGCGVLCTVTRVIMGLLNTASQGIVDATANNTAFQSAVLAVMTLYMTIYGAMVILGMANVALGDAVMRFVKLGAVAMLLTSETVMTFFHMARCFFIEGTTYLINAVMMVGLEAVAELNAGGDVVIGTQYQPTGNANLCGSSFEDASSAQGPLVVLEALLSQVFSAHMGLVLLTLAVSTFYGIILAVFLVFGLAQFVLALLGAVMIYLTALIGQYLLLSLLPFFIVFILFEKTSHLFKGWVNMLLTYSLTPILLFAYISLFVTVVSAALAQILDVKICWAKWVDFIWVFDLYKYQFWEREDGGGPATELPFGFFEVLIFMLLVSLMKSFEGSVEQVARDIGDSFVYVNKAAEEAKEWFRGKGKAIKAKPVSWGKGLAGKAGKFSRGAIGGHSTNSASGQRGTGGIGGGRQNNSSSSVPRKGGKGG